MIDCWSVSCPVCGAKVGETCVGSSTKVHAPRGLLASAKKISEIHRRTPDAHGFVVDFTSMELQK